MNEPGGNFPANNFAATAQAERRGGAVRWLLIAAAALVGFLLALVILLLFGLETGFVPLLIGFTLATLPVPVYLALVLWLDRYEAEPAPLLAAVFFWGALVAVLIAIVFNTVGSLLVSALVNSRAGEVSGAVLFAPIVEESAKASILFVLFFFKRDEFDDVLDGVVYAATVGLGFAMTENIQYYGGAALHGGIPGSLTLFILRGAMAPYSHPLFTSMTGIGLGLAVQSDRRAVKIVAPIAGLAAAMTLHCLWNLSITIHPALYLLLYFLVMVPVFVGVLVAVGFALRREGRIVRAQLQPDTASGLLTPQDLDCLCSVRGRVSASFNALTRGGYATWRTRRQFHGVASELAFHRQRVAHGYRSRDGSDAAREEAYRRELYELRQRLGGR
ncbi:MAG: PrsW family intramembrane metalloprotease [Acidobacteria bacterium]|nr:PrsW family intramembrane metalloprotease [Acidobacteriota bacterium]